VFAWIKRRPLTTLTYPVGSVLGIWFWAGTTRPVWSFPALGTVLVVCLLAPAADKWVHHRRRL
jgi:hypothetical protein